MGFKIFDLGLIDFKQARDFQTEVFQQVRDGQLKTALIVCRHYPVITLGRLANRANILVSEQEIKARGIDLYATDRAGDVTYHGPGQLTVYPIVNLNYFGQDIRCFLSSLEQSALDLLADFGIFAASQPGLTGVWLGEKKIASIGIAIKKWVTYHGISLNIKKDDLANFSLIRPCGMDVEMTSMESVLGCDIEMDKIKEPLLRIFQNIFIRDTAMVG